MSVTRAAQSAPDLTYTKNRKEPAESTSASPHNNTTEAVPSAVLSLSSPQAVLPPDGTLSLLLTVRNTGTVPLSGAVAEVCCDCTALLPMQGSAWFCSADSEPTLIVPRPDDGIILDLPSDIGAGKTAYVMLTLCMHECDFPEQITLSAVLYANSMQAVSSESVTFPVCCANIETRKECVRGSSADRATFRIILTNSGTGSACNITVEDLLPENFCVEHVLYAGFELAENVQYTVVGTKIRILLPTCIRPQTAGEITVTGHFEKNDSKNSFA